LRERAIEKYLADQVKRHGGRSYKWSSPSHRGVPDRLVLFPNVIVSVEVKALGKKPTKLQAYEHRVLRDLGMPVVVVDSKNGVDILIKECRKNGKFLG
jgi:hypothetical protein